MAGKDAEYLQFGGMAVPEGVMMRSPKYYSVACRVPNGEIVVKTEALEKSWIGRQNWLKKPFLRGTLAILDTMALGTKAMNWAASVHLDPQYQVDDPQENQDKKKASSSEKASSKLSESLQIAGAILISLVFGFVVFKAVPEMIGEGGKMLVMGKGDSLSYLAGFWTNFFAGIVKIGFFIGYLSLIRRIPAVYEVFRYHGAEHQAINCVENEVPLSAEAALAQTRLHPRCGTNFAIIVLAIGFLTLLFIPRYPMIFGHQVKGFFEPVLLRIAWELVLLPTIAGVSYEIIRAAGKAKDQRWVNVLLKPGLATQLITTAPPDEKHIEVALASLEAVMEAESTGKLHNTESTEPKPVIDSADSVEDVIT